MCTQDMKILFAAQSTYSSSGIPYLNDDTCSAVTCGCHFILKKYANKQTK